MRALRLWRSGTNCGVVICSSLSTGGRWRTLGMNYYPIVGSSEPVKRGAVEHHREGQTPFGSLAWGIRVVVFSFSADRATEAKRDSERQIRKVKHDAEGKNNMINKLVQVVSKPYYSKKHLLSPALEMLPLWFAGQTMTLGNIPPGSL